MFHLAFLIGGLNAWTNILEKPLFKKNGAVDPKATAVTQINSKSEEADIESVFWSLSFAHIFVPFCQMVSSMAQKRGYHLVERAFNTMSIFYYQSTIFLAQHTQMSANEKYKMENEYSWFIIEILAFYGYILSAVLVIIRNTIVSSCCGLKKHPEEYKGDFIAKQRDNLDWAAFILILFTVNVALISIDLYIYDGCDEKLFPLRNIMYLLLCNHMLQMIFHLFLKSFFRHDGELNLNHQWVWFVLLASYLYVIYLYFCTKIVKNDVS